jgi:hypothetical protein
MKKYFLLSVLFTFITCNLSAQNTFQKTYGSTGWAGFSIQQTTDGGFIMLGKIDSIGAGNSDIYLIRLDYKGDTLWTKIYGGPQFDRGNHILQTSDGGFIFVGYTHSFGAGDADFLVVKTDSAGNIQWNKTYGGTIVDYANKIQSTTDGNFIIIGTTNSFGTGGFYSVLLKIDPLGNLLWYKAYQGPGYPCSSSDGHQTDDGGFILIGGAINVPINDVNACLIKTDSSGNVLWVKTYGGQDGESASTGQQTSDGGYIFARTTSSFGTNGDIYMVKTDASGNLMWSKTYGGTASEYAISVYQSTDGGYVLFGQTQSFGVSLNDWDLILIKTDSSGTLEWSKIYGDTTATGSTMLGTTNDGYIMGGTVNGWSEFFIARSDINGTTGCNETNITPTVTTPPTQTVIPPIVANSFAPAISIPLFAVNYGCTINTICTNVGIEEQTANSTFQIYPNPSAGRFIISFEEVIIKGEVEMLNFLGERIFKENIFHQSKKEINLKNISSGIYFVKVFDGDKGYCKKIIVEQD